MVSYLEKVCVIYLPGLWQFRQCFGCAKRSKLLFWWHDIFKHVKGKKHVYVGHRIGHGSITKIIWYFWGKNQS